MPKKSRVTSWLEFIWGWTLAIATFPLAVVFVVVIVWPVLIVTQVARILFCFSASILYLDIDEFRCYWEKTKLL